MKTPKIKLPEGLGGVGKFLEKNKYVLIVLLVGLAIILWPTGGDSGEDSGAEMEELEDDPLAFSVTEQEEKLAEALSQIEGAGDVTVVLSLKTSLEQEVAVDEDSSGKKETVTVSTGSGTQSEVTIRYIYPEYQGALIVSEGADDPSVKLQITRAVASLTGLGTDKITVSKMKSEY